MTELSISKEEGFTLLELTIVIVLMGIVLAMVLPTFDLLFDSITGKSTERKIFNIVEKVRDQAIISNQEQTILVKDNKLIYRDNAGIEEAFNEGIKRIELKQVEDKKITFYPNRTNSGGVLRGVLANNQEFSLSINPLNGQLSLEE
jgi:general secretion pathway protein H